MTQTPDLARQCAEQVCRDVKPFLTDASLTRWNQEWEESIEKAESLATSRIQSAIDAACAESKAEIERLKREREELLEACKGLLQAARDMRGDFVILKRIQDSTLEAAFEADDAAQAAIKKATQPEAARAESE